jgi:hypothetical protein
MTSRGLGAARPVVVLARDNDATAILSHYLADRFDDVITVAERSESSIALARRRARRLGWMRVTGQLAFVALALPILRWRGRTAVQAIMADANVDASPVAGLQRVESVNATECIALLRNLAPAVVVVQGTRIISPKVLTAVGCPFVNIHPGITPRYRGMHGGYWALAEGRADLVGTTVHMVDAGIDTGTVLACTYFVPGPEDSIATYPYLHLVSGLPAVAEQVALLMKGEPATTSPAPCAPTRVTSSSPGATPVPSESRLWWHPTLWGYLTRRWRTGVR